MKVYADVAMEKANLKNSVPSTTGMFESFNNEERWTFVFQKLSQQQQSPHSEVLSAREDLSTSLPHLDSDLNSQLYFFRRKGVPAALDCNE